MPYILATQSNLPYFCKKVKYTLLLPPVIFGVVWQWSVHHNLSMYLTVDLQLHCISICACDVKTQRSSEQEITFWRVNRKSNVRIRPISSQVLRLHPTLSHCLQPCGALPAASPSPPAIAFVLSNCLRLCCAYPFCSLPFFGLPRVLQNGWIAVGIPDYWRKKSSIHSFALMVLGSKLCSWVLGVEQGLVKL